MKRFLVLLIVMIAALTQAANPFAGMGVNTHGQFLPIDKLKAIGCRWVRCEVPVTESTMERIQPVVRYYRDGGLAQYWTVLQTDANAVATVRILIRCGVREINLGNEPDLADFNPGQKSWLGYRYGQWFASVVRGIGFHKGVRFWGPETSTWSPQYITDAIRGGMKAGGISFHGYHVADLAGVYDSAVRKWGVAAVTENAVLDGTDPALWLVSVGMVMGTRPWVYYDGPETDARGLFAHTSGYTWDGPTKLYQRVLSALVLSN